MSSGGGWMRVVSIDPAKTNSCSGAHHYIANPKPLCARPEGSGCYSAYFSTHGVSYTEVRGFAYGYQVSFCIFLWYLIYVCTSISWSSFTSTFCNSLRKKTVKHAATKCWDLSIVRSCLRIATLPDLQKFTCWVLYSRKFSSAKNFA